MVNVTPNQPRAGGLPTMPPGRPIAAYRTYEQAQRAVDYLSDHRFPVQFVSIVGNDLKMVERVTGRLSYSRVALAGLLSGAYWGIFLGFIFSLFDNRSFGTTVPALGAMGAGFGLIFGLVSYAATGGRRDFTSTSQIVAAEYAVWCAEDHIGAARQMLEQLPDDHRLRDPRHDAPQTPGTGMGQPWPQGPGGPGPQQPWQQGPPPQDPSSPWYPGPGGQGHPQAADPSGWNPAPGGYPAPGAPAPWQGAPGQAATPQQPPAGASPVVQGQDPAGPPPVTGPTYSQMMQERRRRERAEQEERRDQP